MAHSIGPLVARPVRMVPEAFCPGKQWNGAPGRFGTGGSGRLPPSMRPSAARRHAIYRNLVRVMGASAAAVLAGWLWMHRGA